MLQVDANATKASADSTPCVSPQIKAATTDHPVFNEDKLSLLVKAAEKLVDEEKSSTTSAPTQPSESSEPHSAANIAKLNAFVTSLKEAKNAQAFNYPLFIGKNGKPTRPFKAYPKESLSLPIGGQCTSFMHEAAATSPLMPLTVNTSSSPSTPSSCSGSPIALLNKNVLSADSLLSVLNALATQSSTDHLDTQLLSLAAQLRQSDLTCLNLNDLTTFDFTSLAFNANDFCVQHRKRIQQAQDRALKKQMVSGEPCEEHVSHSKPQSHVDYPPDEYMNYPPKKRHRIQHQETKKVNDEEATSSSSSQTEGKAETPVNSPGSATKPVGSSKESVRSRQSSADEIDKDEAYRERRRKNNEAAKRSRDARRAKEDDIALRAALLERENLQLKVELAQLKQETSRLRCLLYNS